MKQVNRNKDISEILEKEFEIKNGKYSIVEFEKEFVIELFEIERVSHKLLKRIYGYFETQNVDVEATDYHWSDSYDEIESFDYELRVLL